MLIWLAACTSPEAVTVVVPPELSDRLGLLITGLGDPRVALETSDEPEREHVRGWRVAVIPDLDCAECFQLDVSGRDLDVHAGDAAGAAYGLGAALEALGWRFPHPLAKHSPSE